jgi:NADPH:quinone reductase-like Zn-dependent oxidoreductase
VPCGYFIGKADDESNRYSSVRQAGSFYENALRPEPKEDEILIRVRAASVNPVDAAIRQGYLAQIIGDKLPLIPGMDAAGVVEKSGAKITKFKPGDAVYAFFTLANEGGYAEFAIAKENETALKPKALSYEEAAAVPAAASTAWQALVETAKLSAGQTVLIHGGSGGVGHFAIQIAKARGAKVIATASTKNQDFLKQLGADQAIDYTKAKFEDVIKDVDVVLDAVGEEHTQAIVRLSEEGRHHCFDRGRSRSSGARCAWDPRHIDPRCSQGKRA